MITYYVEKILNQHFKSPSLLIIYPQLKYCSQNGFNYG